MALVIVFILSTLSPISSISGPKVSFLLHSKKLVSIVILGTNKGKTLANLFSFFSASNALKSQLPRYLN